MKRLHTKWFILFLACLLLSLCVFPSVGGAYPVSGTTLEKQKEIKSAINPINEKPQPNDLKRKVRELSTQRTYNSKQYLLEDGTYQAEIYRDNVHYQDEQGDLQDIMPQLVDESEVTSFKETFSKDFAAKFKHKNKEYTKGIKKDVSNYIAMQVPFNIEIPKKIFNGYSVEKDGNEFKIIPLKASQTAKAVLDNENRSKVTYSNVWNNTDVELIVTSSGIKENIILKNSNSPKKLSFEIIRKIADKKNADNINILPLWLMDKKGTYRDVSAIERKENGKTYLDVEWDETGLEYPITIDPSVVTQPQTPGLAIVNKNGANISPYDIQMGGYQGSNADHQSNTISYVLYSLPALPRDANVINATLSLYYIRYEIMSGNSTNTMPVFSFNPKYVENDITPGATYTWTNKPKDSLPIGSQIQMTLSSYMTNLLYESNVTSIIDTAYKNLKNKLTIAMVSSNHSMAQSDLRVFIGNGYMTNKPSKITINYIINDTTPPTAPKGLKAAMTGSTSCTLRWEPSTDNIGVTSYILYDGNTQLAVTEQPSITLDNLLKDHLYQFNVVALDAFGNRSSKSIINPFYLGIYYIYDISGRIELILYPDGNKLRYIYDLNGNVLKKIIE